MGRGRGECRKGQLIYILNEILLAGSFTGFLAG